MTKKPFGNAAVVNDEQIESLLQVPQMYTVGIAEKIHKFHINAVLHI